MKARSHAPWILALVLAAAGLWGCASEPKPVFSDSKLTVMVKGTDPAEGGALFVTSLWGTSYVGLRGHSPFYVAIPGTRKILFVTAINQEETPVVHIADFAAQAVANIQAPHAKDIGNGIGNEGESIEPTKVLSASERLILLQDRYAGGIRRYAIDTEAGTVSGEWTKPAAAK